MFVGLSDHLNNDKIKPQMKFTFMKEFIKCKKYILTVKHLQDLQLPLRMKGGLWVHSFCLGNTDTG